MAPGARISRAALCVLATAPLGWAQADGIASTCDVDEEGCYFSCDGEHRSCDMGFFGGECVCDEGYPCFCSETMECYATPYCPTPAPIPQPTPRPTLAPVTSEFFCVPDTEECWFS